MKSSELRLERLLYKRIAIWGFGVEAQAMTCYFNQQPEKYDFTVLCTPEEAIDGDISFCHEAVSSMLLNSYDLIIKSPGISPYVEPAKSTTTPMVSSAAIWFANHKNCPVIAITGTKGKSTTSSMLAHVLSEMRFAVALAGNIGRPLIECQEKYDYVVLETSSYQAQDGYLKADVAVLLNLFPEHLNWHLNEDTYYNDKMRLLNASQLQLFNAQDPQSLSVLQHSNGPTSERKYFNQFENYHIMDNVLMYRDKALLSQFGWALPGEHNLLNAAALLRVIELLGLDVKKAINALRTFKPLPHRLQQVCKQQGVVYIDDSIASTPVASLAALKSVNSKRTIILLGGFDRGVSWQSFALEICGQPPKAIICSGQNGVQIHTILQATGVKTDLYLYQSLAEAFAQAQTLACRGDTILLSPGAPSFDAFDNYKERGNSFQQWIKK